MEVTTANGTKHSNQTLSEHAINGRAKPIRLGNVAAKLPEIVRIESDHVQIQILDLFVDLFFVQNTNYGVFAVHRGHDRNAEINISSFVAHPKAAILRHAAFGNVEFGHD